MATIPTPEPPAIPNPEPEAPEPKIEPPDPRKNQPIEEPGKDPPQHGL